MKFLGVQTLIVSNASGGVNPAYQVGDVVAITDHINFFPEHPLRGHNDERLGPRFLNMSEPYSKKMIKQAMEISQTLGLNIKKGIYLGLQGPTFETLAEYMMVKKVGGDCVGMSTVPEVIVAKHMGMDCFGISVISDMGDEESIAEVNHHEVLMAVKKAEPKMRLLVKELILNI
jgi:purine-nucleoside phosphorylase